MSLKPFSQHCPTYGVYTLETKNDPGAPDQDPKTHWYQIGVAWFHKDGQGLNVKLNALPLDRKITLRRLESKSPTASEDPRA